MEQGTIKTVTEKGYGFITREGESKDLFFHSSELKNCRYNELRGGERVEFEVKSGEKGKFAANIHLLED